MASFKNTDLDGLFAFVEEQKTLFKTDMETVEKALEILRRWAASRQSGPLGLAPGRKTVESPVREIVLETLGSQTTFKLGALIDRLIATGKMSGDKRAIYGTVTGMMRRNGHIFKKIKRGVYRVLRPTVEAHEKSATEDQHEMGAQPAGLSATLKEYDFESPSPAAPIEQRLKMALAKSA